MKKKKFMHPGLKRLLSLVLTAAMLLGMVPAEAFAAEDLAYVIWVNDKNTTAAQSACVTYGDSLEAKLKDAAGTVIATPIIFWQTYDANRTPSDADTWNTWSEGAPTEPGSYYLGYYFSDSEGNSKNSYDGSFVLTINKAQAAAPTELKWTGGVASWGAVTQNTTGGALAAGAVTGYSVTLKKNGTPVGDSVTAVGTSYDFSDIIKTNGSGVYTFAVKATVPDTDHYTESAETVSGNKTAATVTVVCGTGIASVTPTDPATLISGVTGKESIKLSATVSDGRSFSGWTVSPAGAVAFADASETSTTATIAADYAGDAAVTITANTSDTTAPTISEYAAGTDSDYGKLTGTAADAGSGVAKYAFSTAANAADVKEDEWQTPEGGTAASVAVSQKVTAAGVYSLYVQDASGNTTKSDHTIQATEVDYSGFYDNGAAVASRKDFFVGTEALMLATPTRPGYSFGGWFAASDLSGEAVTTVSAHSETAVTFYAKWTRNEFSISTQPADYSGEYDGKSHELSVALGSVTGDVTYQWYKDGTAVKGATTATLAVKKFDDSGKYTVVVTVTLDGDAKTATSSTATVTISKKALSLTADSQTVTYGAAAPAYSYTADGFVEGEDKSVLTGGSIACAYNPASAENSAARDYPITISGYTNANYEITFVNGTLTVSKKGESADVTATLDKTDWTYTGEDIKPAVTVKDGEKTLTAGTDYALAYSDNVDVGTGTVTVTLTGNYSGTIALTFTISKASGTATVTLAGWTYGETAGTPTVSSNPGSGDVTYYYYSTDRSAATTTQPTAAGDYQVYAVIAATANYAEVTTEPVKFTIAKRVIKLTAASGTWAYDGNSHSDATYSQSGSFAGKDGFQSVIVTGSITNVGTAVNKIEYTLTSVTESHREDYDIQTAGGTLEVYNRDLTVPTGYAWDASNPGTATWVAVTRDGLTVSYSIELYRLVDGKYALLKTFSSDTNSYNFATVIREDSTANGVAGYSFTVKAVPSGGDNKGNYRESTYSTYASDIYTASVSVTGGNGIKTATIGGGQSAILIQGESAALAATATKGYSFSDAVWTTASTAVTISDAKKADTTLKLNALTSAQEISVAASCGDDLPVITGFSAEANATNTAVTFTFSATDTKGIVAWAVTTSTTAPTEWTEEVTSTTALDKQTLSGVTAAGTYYVWVKDDGGNVVCSASNSTGAKSIEIYQISFAAGDGGSGTMASLLKVENTAVTLPANTFTKSGYSFQNWKGTTGSIYADGGSYAANASDTLTAQWTDQQFTYTVNYYLMGMDGTYSETASSTASYSGAYGAEITPTSPAVALTQAGMQLDTDKSTKSITLTGNGLALNVYYQRLQYTITYSYTEPGKTETTHEDTYYYGAKVTEYEKPTLDGYSFVGWVYSGSGTAPKTMPANDLTATGSFAAADASYVINCYEQNVDDSTSYTLVNSLGSTVAARQGDSVTKTTADAAAIEGFTAACVTVSSGAVGGSTPAGTGTSATGTVSAQTNTQLNINYYYTRNSYSLTLNVYKSNLRTDKLYTYTEKRLYGAEINAAAFAIYNQANWGTPPTGTVLAAYEDWSTGTAPSTMPAGDVSVARDYIRAIEAPYKVEVYCETTETGKYALQATLNYYGYAGTKVTVGNANTDSVDYTKFTSSVKDFAYYDFNANNTGNVMSGVVKEDGSTTMKVYFDRKSYATTITYYYNDGGTSTKDTAFATVTKTGKWGSTYTCQPLALFDGTVPATWDNNGVYTVNDSTKTNCDFKSNSYMADYVAYYWDYGNHWTSRKFTTADSLTAHAGDTYTFGKNNSGYVAVYYVKTDPAEHYTLDVVYNPTGLAKAGDKANHPLTVTIGGKTYKVRVANKADVFKSTWTSSATEADIAAYPALETYAGNYSYGDTETLRDGFSAVTVTRTADGKSVAGTYYLNSAEPNYIYVIDAENQFFRGNRAGYNFLNDELNTALLGYDSVEQYLTTYQTAHGDSAAADNKDDKYKGAYIYNNGFSSIMYASGTYTFSFAYHDTYSVSYTMNGNTHTDNGYTQGETVTPACTDTGAFPTKTGYTVVWYTDTSFTTRASTFNITGDTIFYGRYERSTISYKIYNYYQLPDGSYIIDPTAAGLTHEDSTEKISFTDGAGVTDANAAIKITKYYNSAKILVMAVREVPCLSFTEVSLNYNSYTEGLVYDDANPKNVTKGYCEDAGISLVSYYIRGQYTLAVNAKNEDVENTTTTAYLAGQAVTLAKPVKAGYLFAGWTWQKWDSESSQWVDWTDTPTAADDGSVSFAMPQYNVQATANWTPTDYTSAIVHYFQTTGGTYDTALYAQLAAATATDSSAAITYNNVSYTGSIYKSGDTVLGASIVVDGNTYYFSAVTGSGPYAADVADLIAVSVPVTAKSETSFTVSDKALSLTNSPYTFAYVICRTGSAMTTLAGTDSFSYGAKTKVAYYYTRAGGYAVTVSDASTENAAATGLTVSGGGTYSYGEHITVRASAAAGYTFKGWYKKADDYTSATALSTDAAYSFRVTGSLELVALSTPNAAATPNVTLSGQSSYIFGYSAAKTNAITASVAFPTGTDSANKVVSYQWYSVDGETRTAIDGATAATYLFPAGKACGTYKYQCDVVIERTDNGKRATVPSNVFAVTVSPADMSVTVAGYDGSYDGKEHGISVKVNMTAGTSTVYYSTTEITKDNYSTASKTPLTYKDVHMDGTAVGSYMVYYYVHNTDTNYSDVTGSSTITIHPIPVMLKASGSYHKAYDGKMAVSGTVTDKTTDKGTLSQGTSFSIVGLLDADRAYYIADFDANFNNKDVDSASAVTLSNIKIVSKTNAESVNYNYSFASSYTVTLSGYITPCVLDVEWDSTTSFPYNGTTQTPTIELKTDKSKLPEPAIADGLSVQGGQINAGSYTAYAVITANTAYKLSNYSFSTASCPYTITKRAVTITPALPAESVTYDKATHFTDGFVIGGTDGLATVDGKIQTYTAQTDKGALNAGTTAITPQNMHIFQSGTDVTDNYAITYKSADFVIKPKTVTVSGFTADDKAYDGTASATVHAGSVTFTGLIAGDVLSIADKDISGTFDTAQVGTGKTVTVALDATDLGGTSKDNYSLDVDGSTRKTTAAITDSTIKVTVTGVSQTAVYGENVTFGVTYSGLQNGELDSSITGTVGYGIRKAGTTDEPVEYTTKTPAGTYDIILDVSGLHCSNYTFEAVPAKLTVSPRPLTVKASDNPSVTKEYDTNATAAIDSGDYAFAAVDGNAASGIVNGDTVTLSEYTAAYNSKDVTDAKTVTVSNMTLDNPNYKLANSTFDITVGCSITPKKLTVTAENKSITYGDNAPDYTASFDGFVGGETSAVLGTPAFTCSYDTSKAETRGAGSYVITPSGYTSGNYAITYTAGKLTVGKAVITVTADAKEIGYGDSSTQTYTSKYTGFKYDEIATDVVKGTLTTNCTKTSSDLPGTYTGAITPDISGLSADNYTFTPVSANLTVTQHTLKISGITVNGKTYDGTTAVAASQINTGAINYDGILEADKTSAGVTVTGVYDTKDCGTGKTVTLTVTLNDYLKARYALAADSQKTATAAITQAPLTVTVGSKTIKYGDAEPAYSVTYSGFVNKETSSVLSGTPAYSEDYGTNSSVGSYTVKASGYDTNGNYAITYADGTLTVVQAQLATPTVTWSTTAPGTVNWTKPANIGAVTVGGYTVVLQKDGVAVETVNVTLPDELSHDFLAKMRESGAGAYTVQVTALASETNNTNKANVADSEAGGSAAKYAANVKVQFASDAVSQTGTAITINSAASYVMIAGESAPIAATLKNATGYSVKSFLGTALSFSGTTQTGTDVSSTAALSTDLASADDITATLTLTATPATLTVTVTGNPATATYGYTAENAPKLTATVAPASGDNYSNYTYTYQWYLKEGGSAPKKMDNGTGTSVTFPIGKNAADSLYKVYCTVTATRKDNAQSTTVNSSNSIVIITPAQFSSTVSLAGWTYGAVRSTPSVGRNSGEGSVVYEYNSSGTATDGWTTTIPKDAGSYYVRAKIAKTTNYQEFQTPPVEFKIAKAKLAAPTGLTMDASKTAPYGKVSWNKVDGLQENAGTDSASTVSVKYRVTLYRAETEGGSLTTVYSTDTADTTLDLTSQFSQKGFYKFGVTALSSNTANCDNSDEQMSVVTEIKSTMTEDTETKVYDGTPITLDASYSGENVTAYQWYRNDTAVQGATNKTLALTYVAQTGTYTCKMTVNGSDYYSSNHVVTITPMAVTVTSATDSKTYDGTPLAGKLVSTPVLGTGDTIEYTLASITNVGNTSNAITGVTIKHGSDTVFTENGKDNCYTLTKTPGALTVTAKSLGSGTSYTAGITVSQPAAETYDGKTHTPAVTVTDSKIGSGKTLVSGTDYTLSYTGNIHAGTATITVTGKGNYSGSVTRSFTINQKAVTLVAGSASRAYDGKALTSNTCSGSALAEGDSIDASSVTCGGKITDIGSVGNSITAVKIKHADGTDAAKDYSLSYTEGTLTVTAITAPIVVTANSNSKTYDGKALTDSGFSCTQGILISGDILTATVTGSQTDAGESANTVTSYEVKRGDTVVTGNYTFGTSVNGKLTVSKRPVTLTSRTDTKVYDGTALTNSTVTVGGSGFVSGQGATYSVTGTQTDKGTSDNAFTYTLNSNTKADNYTITKTEGKLTVTAKPVTITVSNASKVYGTADPTFTGTVTGLVNDSDLGTVTYSRTGSDANVGTYTGVLTANFTENTNYTVTVTNGSFSITPSGTLTVTGTDYTGTYDGAAHGAAATANVTEGTTVSYSTNDGTSWSTTAPTITNAGTLTVKIKAENSNYATATGSYTLTVAKKPVTITVNSTSKTYGAADPTFTGTVTGLVNSGDLGAVTYSRTNSTVNNAGAYTGVLTASYTENPNYAVTVTKGGFTIGRANTLTVIGTGYSAKYDGAAHGAAAAASVTSGTTVSYSTDDGASWSTSAPAITDVGTLPVQIKAENANYETATGSCTLTVTKRAVTLTSGTGSKTYDGTALTKHDVAVSGDGFAAGEGATYTFTGSQLDPGESDNSFTYTLKDNTKAGNYDITTAVGKLTVSKITTPIVVTANSKSKDYDGAALTDGGVTFTPNVLASGDTLTAVVEGSQTDVGNSANTVKSYQVKRGETDVTANYTFGESVNGTLTVTSAALSVTGSGYKGSYDGKAHGITVTAPEGAAVKYRTAASGTYDLTENPTITDVGSETVYYEVTKANYTTYTGSAALEISRAPLTVTYAGESVAYGTAPKLAVAVTGFVNGETAETAKNYTAPTLANASAAVSTYTLTPAGGSADNYSFQYVPGTLTITKKPVTAIWKDSTKVYTGAGQHPTVDLPDGSAVTGEAVDVAVESKTDAGSYTITASLTGTNADNYTLTNPIGSFLIQRAPVTFTVTNSTAEYDGKAKTATVSAKANGSSFTAYKLSYKNSAGTSVEPKEVGSYDIYAELTDTNFRHAGTTDGSALKIGVLTIYEKAKPATYTVKFDGGGATAGSVAEIGDVQAETVLVLPANGFTRTGYSFTGWLYNGGVYQPGARFTQPAANVTMTAQWTKNTYEVGGIVNSNNQPVTNAVVTLMLGSNQIEQKTTDSAGKYSFTGVLPGTYNLVASYNGIVQTVKAVITTANVTAETISLPAGKTNSVVEVEAGTPNIVVGNLEKTFVNTDTTVYTAENKEAVEKEGATVEVKLTAKDKPEGSEKIETAVKQADSKAVVGIYIDLDLSKTVTTVTTTPGGTTTATTGEPITLYESNVLLETIIPLTGDLQGKNGYSVYREHKDSDKDKPSVVSIPQNTPNSDGEYFTVNDAKTVITVHAKKFSTYAITYTEASPVSPVQPVQPDGGGGAGGGGGGAAGGSAGYAVTTAESTGGSTVSDQASAAESSKVTITVTAAKGSRLSDIKAVDADGNAVALTDNRDGTYSFTMPASAVTVTPSFAQKPADPKETGVAEKLETLNHIHYISGYPNGTVGPERNMTRAEAAQMFYNLLLNKAAGGTAFSDVSSGAWYAKAVGALTKLGIIKGYGDGRFGPNDSITREQFCAMAVRFTSVAGTGQGTGFTDVAKSQWSYGSVMAASSLGWINGYPDGSFGPAQTITRAQVVTIVNHMLDRSADTVYVDAHASALVGFSDLRDSGKWYYYDMVEAADKHDHDTNTAGQEIWFDSAA